jgi:ABC-type antimicrobial peptide transport system permease subunit
VSIEAAMILTITGVRHGVNANPTAVRLVFTLWASVLFLFISCVGFLFISIERYFSAIEKTQEFGVLKVLGASMRYFLLLLLIETCAICVPGTVGGIGLTFLMGWGVASAFPKFLQLDVVYPSCPIAFGITATASMIGGIIGARRAIRTGVIQAQSYEG